MFFAFNFAGMEIRPSAQQMLPPVVKNLLIINAIVFLAVQAVGESFPFNPIEQLAMFYFESPFFKPWQILTHMFMHGSIMHIAFNMFGLWMFGTIIERRLGSKRFLQFYILCGIGAAICHQLVQYIEVQYMAANILGVPTVGASGAVMGIFLAFGYLFPNAILHLYFAIPVKAKYAIAGFAAIDLFGGISNNPGDNIAHFAHLGGMLAAFIIFKFWKIDYNSG